MAREKPLRIEFIDDYHCLVNDEIIKLSGMGGCRRKCFYDNYIIKFDEPDDPKFPEDNSQNLREILLWKKISKKDRQYFPKMIQYSVRNHFIVQERIKFKRGRKAYAHRAIILGLIRKYNISDIGFCGINDNWGVRENGVPVIYDYGLTE